MLADNITVNVQSSIRIEGERIVRFDPFRISDPLHDADIILITHAHFDHLDPDSVKNVKKADTIFVVPASMREEVKEHVAGHTVHYLKPGDEIDIGPVHVKAVPAYNLNKPFHPKDNQWLGYVVTMDKVRYYAAGDTDAAEELKRIACDVAMVPIGGTYTMIAPEAAALVNEIHPRVAIPIHYGSVVGSDADAVEFQRLVAMDILVVKKL